MQRERLEKLAMQAIINVAQNEDEFVKTLLGAHDKVCMTCGKVNLPGILLKLDQAIK